MRQLNARERHVAAMGSEARPLYGGAMRVELPRGWLDASDVRPVPDHQEVFTEAAGAQRSIVIELVEPLDGTADALACVREHFEELASECRRAHVERCEALDVGSAPGVNAASVATLHGVQDVSPAVLLHVRLALMRLAGHGTDILITLHRPLPRPPSLDAEGSLDAAAADTGLLHALLRSLRVDDYGLFHPPG